MNKIFGLLAAALALTILSACNKGLEGDPKIKSSDDSTAYSIGLTVGKDLSNNFDQAFEGSDFKMNHDLLVKGIFDALSKKPGLTDKEMQKVLAAFDMRLREKQMAAAKSKGEEAGKKGAEFLAAKEKEGFTKTASGLLYRVVKAGTGKTPGKGNTVKVHYEGKLVDGTVFDSSIERGEPIDLSVSGVIPGWTEGLQLMKEGGKYELAIPGNLAYGDRGAGDKIGPNETLFFTIELIKIVK